MLRINRVRTEDKDKKGETTKKGSGAGLKGWGTALQGCKPPMKLKVHAK